MAPEAVGSWGLKRVRFADNKQFVFFGLDLEKGFVWVRLVKKLFPRQTALPARAALVRLAGAFRRWAIETRRCPPIPGIACGEGAIGRRRDEAMAEKGFLLV